MVNRVILIGYLGRDPEVRFTQGGAAVANFTMATNERWKDRDGVAQQKAEWHRIVAWGKLAEFCERYLSKGRQIYLEGRIQTREWEDREGDKRRTTEIVAQTIQFVGPKPGESRESDDEGDQPEGSGGSSGGGAGDDSIPF